MTTVETWTVLLATWRRIVLAIVAKFLPRRRHKRIDAEIATMSAAAGHLARRPEGKSEPAVSTPQVKRFKKRWRNGFGNANAGVSETPPETDTEAETETEIRIKNKIKIKIGDAR